MGPDLQNIIRFIIRLSEVYRKVDLRMAGFKGGGKLGSCPGAFTTKGPPQQKHFFKLLPMET